MLKFTSVFSGSRRLGQSTSTRSTYLSNSKIKLQISFSRTVENMINKALDPVYEFDPNYLPDRAAGVIEDVGLNSSCLGRIQTVKAVGEVR